MQPTEPAPAANDAFAALQTQLLEVGAVGLKMEHAAKMEELAARLKLERDRSWQSFALSAGVTVAACAVIVGSFVTGRPEFAMPALTALIGFAAGKLSNRPKLGQ